MPYSERFLHFVWKTKLFSENLVTTCGKAVEVVNTGLHNSDAGPDFLGSKLRIDGMLWVGNVEIHINASDWVKHKHSKNKAYDSVLLHIVKNADCKVFRQNGQEIPVAEIKIPEQLISNYKLLTDNSHDIPCTKSLSKISNLTLVQTIDNLMIERMLQKTTSVELILKKTINSWEETFYIFLARAFGTKVNSLPFELLAKSLPLAILAKHGSNLFQLEALLFGQAGMLNKDCTDDYFQKLQKEYLFLKHKYSLLPIELSLWKFLRLRPANFPTLRIAQFANLVEKSTHLFSKLMEAKTINEIRKMFEIKASKYWDEHYNFGKISVKKSKKFGKTTTNSILINTVIPFLFIFGEHTLQEKYQEKALQMLTDLPAENNNIVRLWKQNKINPKNAYETQALTQLKNEYCDKKKCVECKIGTQVISTK